MAKDIDTKVVLNNLEFITNDNMDQEVFLKKLVRVKVNDQNHIISF